MMKGLPHPNDDPEMHRGLIEQISQRPLQEAGHSELDYLLQILGEPNFHDEALINRVLGEFSERDEDYKNTERHPIYTDSPMFAGHRDWQDMNKMDIAFQLLKERKSPAAMAHKLEYDKQYQKNPKRVKYREQLNRERRKRGIYGKGGKDVSHTQGGKLTLESPHSNRARHFKNRGTLRRVKVV
tara:strand:+ start:206 stop:757 length:552 start_codon:yes stop_codon:yes gene_type:complete